jgi:putative transposase
MPSFIFEQHLTTLKDCLKQALLKRGLPRRLYFDNGRIFRSRALLCLAAHLGLQLLHTRPYQPQGRAKLERWFGTVRTTFLARLDPKAFTDLAYLNRLLFAWIEGAYHVAPHRALGDQTPLDCWMRACEALRPLPRDLDLDQLFLEQVRRLVTKDGTLSLKGKRFEAGPFFIGQKLELRFEPFDLRRIWRVETDGSLRELFPVDLSGNRRVQRMPPPPPAPKAPPPLHALDQLRQRVEAQHHPTTPSQEPQA